MSRWEYTLKSGRKLRSSIKDGDPMKVLDMLRQSYKELLDVGIIDDSDYESYIEDFELYDADDEDIEESVDYELDNFFDLCDNLRVWVPIP